MVITKIFSKDLILTTQKRAMYQQLRILKNELDNERTLYLTKRKELIQIKEKIKKIKEEILKLRNINFLKNINN